MTTTGFLPPGTTIRSPRTGDVLAGGLPPPPPDRDEPAWRRSVVAERGGQVVGSASAMLSRVNDVYFCEVDVSPAHRRQGLGTALYRTLCARTEHSFPMCTRAMASRPLRRLFAEAIGCEVLLHCPDPWADPTAPAWRHWVAEHVPPAGYAVVPISDVPPAAVEEAWKEYFVWVHAWLAPMRVDRLGELWNDYAGLDRDASMALTGVGDGGAVVAFSLVSPEAWDGRTMIVSETVRPDQPDGDGLLRAAVAASLQVLGDRGFTRVELEGHATDPHSPALLAGLPAHDADPMDILRLRRL